MYEEYYNDAILYDDYEYEDMIQYILEWANAHCWFDTTTIEGIQDNYNIYGNFTEPQKIAIENIYFKFHVDIWRSKNR